MGYLWPLVSDINVGFEWWAGLEPRSSRTMCLCADHLAAASSLNLLCVTTQMWDTGQVPHDDIVSSNNGDICFDVKDVYVLIYTWLVFFSLQILGNSV